MKFSISLLMEHRYFWRYYTTFHTEIGTQHEPCANTTLGFQQYSRELRVCMDRPSSPGTLPSARGLERLRLCPGQRQHRQGSTSYLHCSEGTHLGMFLLHIPPGLTLAVKTAKGSKLVSSGMGFPPTQRDHELPAVAKLSQNTHSYFKTAISLISIS